MVVYTSNTRMPNNKFDALKNDDSGEDDDNEAMDEHKEHMKNKPPREVPPGEHRLQYPYSLWFSRKQPGRGTTASSYEHTVKLVATVSSVEQFWAYYSHIKRPSVLSGHCDFHLFKYGIKPMWEDEANKDGGKWIVRLKKGIGSRAWENLILAMLGEQFMVGEEVCGAVISIRYNEDIVSIWNRSAQDQAVTGRIRDTLQRVLNLPQNTIMEYKTHRDSLTENSNFMR